MQEKKRQERETIHSNFLIDYTHFKNETCHNFK